MENFWIRHRLSEENFRLLHHYEHCYQVLFLIKGKVGYQVGTKNYTVEKGSMILLNTLEDHYLEVLEYPYERILFQISPTWFSQEIKCPGLISAFIKNDNIFSHMITVSEPVWEYLKKILCDMLAEVSEKKEYWEYALASDLRLFFICLKRVCPEAFSKESESLASTIAFRILNYIDEHFAEEITIDSIAKKMNFNRHYISHVFKNVIGYSIMDYVLSLRINRAKELLTHTKEKISDISLKCGYTDFAYFSRIFKRSTGVSPRTFRNEKGNFKFLAD